MCMHEISEMLGKVSFLCTRKFNYTPAVKHAAFHIAAFIDNFNLLMHPK